MKPTPSATFLLAAITTGALSTGALANSPTLGGPMSHLLVTLFQNQIYLTYESPSLAVVDMQDSSGDFTGGASVLNNSGYNGQFGWLANGFISLPPDSGIFVRTVSISQHLDVYEQGSFSEIMGTHNSEEIWQWNGTMVHNWYSTDTHGTHHASYEVFIGDSNGNPLDGFQSGTIDLNFRYGPDLSGRVGTIGSIGESISGTVPAPASLLPIVSGVLIIRSRRR